ncbi:TonB family protein [Paraburkholderia xenovorans]|uniref:energy transducer TonB n=1 Tax=Paraburkholderia xenovorans TaxID=36873 RepID=UPI0038BBD755
MAEGVASGEKWTGRPRQYGASQKGSARRYGGIALVVLLHVVLIWALVNGLATKVVQIVQQPVVARIIEAAKPPAPLPVVKPSAPTPPQAKPQPRVVTHREVPVPAPTPIVQPPTPSAAAISTPTPTPTPSPAPVAAPTVAPPAPPKPVSHEAGVVCPNSDNVRASLTYPQQARDNDITGDVLITFSVDTQGHVTDEKVEKSADPILDRAALNAVRKFNCISQGQSVRVQVPFSFNLN